VIRVYGAMGDDGDSARKSFEEARQPSGADHAASMNGDAPQMLPT